MKKALALILTVAMLLSTVAMSVAAVREFSVTTVTTPANKYWQYDADNLYFNAEIGDYLAMDVRLDAADSCTYEWGSNVPLIDATGVGVGGATKLPYTFVPGTWYNIVWDVVDGGTQISVNGTVLGTVSATLSNRPAAGYNLVSIDNIVAANFSEDFEDGVWNNGKGDSAGVLIEEKESTVTTVNNNDNVVYNSGTAKYWQYDADNLYFNAEIGDYLAMDVRLDAADSCTYEWGSNVPLIDATGVGVGGAAKLPYTFVPGTWYNIVWDVVDGGTQISVNGTVLGTVSATLSNRPAVGYNLVSIDNIVAANFSEDFEDGVWNNGKGDSAGVLIEETYKNKTASYDLGKKYWQYDADNLYFNAEIGGYLEMDICLDAADSCTYEWGSNVPLIDTTGIGVGGATKLPYTFVPGTWYHVIWDVVDGGTQITVDGKVLGTVSATLNSRPAAGYNLVSMDNIKGENFFEDFEDGVWNNCKGDSAGICSDYDFGVVPEVSLMDKIAVTTPGGEAVLLESDTNAAYFYGDNDHGKNYAISFDLALIPNDKDTAVNSEGHKFEFWRETNGTMKRFVVGTEFAGVNDDTKEYAYIEGMENGWGEATWDNFHNVILIFDGNKAELYVDRCLAWSGPAANKYDRTFIGMLINTSAIIDNYTVYDLEGNVLTDSFPVNNWTDDSYMDPVTVNLDTADFCADNCHVYGATERTTKETCTNAGVDTVWCAICGGAKSETEIAMLPHQYNKFDNNRVADGKYYTDCKNCGKRLYSAVPEEGTYTGTITAYFDMSDAMFGELDNGDTDAVNSNWFGDQFRYEDGKAILDADSYLVNYSEFSFAGHLQQAVSSKDWSYSFKMTYNGTWMADNNWDGYDNAMYWWLRGVSLELGYNAVAGEWYIGPSANPGAVTIERVAAAYEFKEGLTYDVKFGLMFDDDEEYAEITIYVNNELVLIHSVDETGADIYYDCDFGTDTIETIYCRNFGFSYVMDDLVIGSYDFAWNKVIGDVDNDGALTAADALMMRKYLAKVIGDADVNLDLMDVNGDGVINAKDQLTLRKALAA